MIFSLSMCTTDWQRFECCTGRWFIEGSAVGRQQGQTAAGQAACPGAVPCHQWHQASDRCPQSIRRSGLDGPGGLTFASSFDEIMCLGLMLASSFHLIMYNVHVLLHAPDSVSLPDLLDAALNTLETCCICLL